MTFCQLLFWVAGVQQSAVGNQAGQAKATSGYRVHVQRVSVIQNAPPQPFARAPIFGHTAYLYLQVQSPTRNPVEIYAFDDSRFSNGIRAVSQGHPYSDRFEFSKHVKDEWLGIMALDGIPPGLRKIDRFSGTVIAYRRAEVVRHDLAITKARPPFRLDGPLQIDVSTLSVDRAGVVRLRFHVRWPADVELSTPAGPGCPTPAVKHRSGVVEVCQAMQTRGDHDLPNEMTVECHTQSSGPCPPVALIWGVALRADPSMRIPFEINNIRLPVARNWDEQMLKPSEPVRPWDTFIDPWN